MFAFYSPVFGQAPSLTLCSVPSSWTARLRGAIPFPPVSSPPAASRSTQTARCKTRAFLLETSLQPSVSETCVDPLWNFAINPSLLCRLQSCNYTRWLYDSVEGPLL
eukprot:6200942-Pleurochrysis_carterae.AAC.1